MKIKKNFELKSISHVKCEMYSLSFLFIRLNTFETGKELYMVIYLDIFTL